MKKLIWLPEPGVSKMHFRTFVVVAGRPINILQSTAFGCPIFQQGSVKALETVEVF